MKYFFYYLEERNGEQEYSYRKVVEAENLEEAKYAAEEYAYTFYGEIDEIVDNEYHFLGGQIAVYVGEIIEIPKEHYDILNQYL